ncbi:hypothetical protein B0A48_09621 [Cryoendolithus antarcticus]|uniref:Fcf2 pre-rRNA processing C-terminal domain-containing protein n=1 Tax=Cryoendolithus antarcticus TaxID=1507870 RepID=A0A1V8T0F3_9PEZI|nr:hypothetical protein B0A48_09621 [Cryoendolithus antarcticus]
MATSSAPPDLARIVEDMTDEHMEALLAEATVRLKQKERSKATPNYNYSFPKLDAGKAEEPYIVSNGNAVETNTSRLLEDKAHNDKYGIRKVEDPVAVKKLAIEKKKATAGKAWYDLPRTDLTPELKRDLQLLKMRNVLDPHRHYKKDGGKMKAPEYSQVGTIVEGATEFFSGRIENKQRKKTLVEEVLAGERHTGRFKKKYGEVQNHKTSGKKAYYKDVLAKRKGGVKKGGG